MSQNKDKNNNQQLPPKEQSIFKRIVKCYEQKLYKNGLKFAKQILSNPKYSEHGETLAMKGLILNYMGKKEEAWELVKRGLKSNLKSCICWHVFGLLQRAERKYDEAMKAYKCALRFESDNMQILRDLSLLQIQMRILDGYRETRYQLLLLRPQQKASWIGYAMSFHLLEDYEGALTILNEYCKTLKPAKYDYEHSELLLYMVSVMLEAGQLRESLDFLAEHDAQLMDRTYVKETRARVFFELGRPTEAEELVRELIDVNPENKDYYRQLEQAVQVTDVTEKLQLYDQLRSKHPRAAMPKRLPLQFLEGEQFQLHVDAYLRENFHKGIPQLFKLVDHLYTDSTKVSTIEALVLGYRENLMTCSAFAPDASDKEPPSTLVWTNYFLAQHFSKLGLSPRALQIIEETIEHTPTLTELYSLKGQILKEAGNIVQASECLKEAQSLDTADRYVNSVCARYMIQAGQMSEAEELLGRFTREGTVAGDHLADMQCMWYLTECAAAYKRLGQFGQALKKCHEVDRHFGEMIEDQFDFHSYCLRKMTLRAYVQMLRLEDKLKAHPYYFTAARLAIEIYLQLHRQPLGSEADQLAEEMKNLSASEAKKMRNKQKRAQRKAEQEKEKQRLEEQRQNLAKKQKDESDAEPGSFKEESLDPEKLARPEKPLDEAVRFLKPLLELSPNRIETQCLAYEVYAARQRPLLMLRSLVKAKGIDPQHPWLHKCIVRFLSFFNSAEKTNDTVRRLIGEQLPDLAGANFSSPAAYNDAYLAANSDCLERVHSALCAKYELEANQDACLQRLRSLLSRPQQLDLCQQVFADLRAGSYGRLADAELESLRAGLHLQFPLAAAFQPPPTDAGDEVNGADPVASDQ